MEIVYDNQLAGSPRLPVTTPAVPVAPPAAARWALSSLFLLNGLLFSTWVSRIPAIEIQRGLNHATLGVALLAVALGALIAMPAAGALTARIGASRVCQISALLYCAALPLLALAPDLWVWGVALLLFGAGHGALDVGMNAHAVAIEKSYQRPIMSSFHALFSVGGLLGAVLGGGFAAMGLRPEVHFAFVGVMLAGMAFVAFPHLLTSVNPAGETSERRLPEVKRPAFSLPSKGLIALGVVALCIMMGEGAMADWSAVYLKRVVGTADGIAAVGYAAFSIAMAGGRFAGDGLAHRFGPEKLVRWSASLAVIGLLVALLIPNAAAVLIGFALVGAGYATIVPMVFSAAGNTPGVSPGVALASVTTVGYMGFLLGPPIIGFAAEMIGLRVALGILVASTLMAVTMAAKVRR